MSKNYWTSAQDFEEDMLAISDFCDSSFKRHKEPPSNHTRKARSRAAFHGTSIYDDLSDDEEQKPIQLGRGRPINGRINLRNPGGALSTLSLEEQTARDIREACGMNFSNRLENQESEELKSTTEIMPDIRLSPANVSPVLSSPSSQHEGVTNNKAIAKSVYKPVVQASKNKPLPALYDILKSNRRKPTEMKKETSSNEVPKNGYKSFNIDSKNDFPELS